jgi:mannose-6-phosphate isomerase
MTIVELSSNRPPERFYRGGARIAEFRGIDPVGEREPEDWVGSVTTVRGDESAGLTRLSDGRLLTDAVAADPDHWLGAEHVAAYGADPMLLVKLLDAGQRLPVHAHPDRDFASAHLGSAHGKTEAWYILTPGSVWLALNRDLSAKEFATILERQDMPLLLSSMHRIEVERGDAVLVPAGVLHAIGEGILLVEVQEPEDLSILVEWAGFAIDGPALGHLGLGFELASEAVETTARDADAVRMLIHRRDAAELLPLVAEPFFRLDRLVVDGESLLDPGFAIFVGLEGAITASSEDGASAELGRGSTLLVAAAAGQVALTGEGIVLRCRPPAVSPPATIVNG